MPKVVAQIQIPKDLTKEDAEIVSKDAVRMIRSIMCRDTLRKMVAVGIIQGIVSIGAIAACVFGSIIYKNDPVIGILAVAIIALSYEGVVKTDFLGNLKKFGLDPQAKINISDTLIGFGWLLLFMVMGIPMYADALKSCIVTNKLDEFICFSYPALALLLQALKLHLDNRFLDLSEMYVIQKSMDIELEKV